MGPADHVVGRTNGPAASVAVVEGGAVVAYAVREAARSRVEVTTLTTTHAASGAPTRVSRDSGTRQHPPLALANDGAVWLVWRETRPGEPGRLLWSAREDHGPFARPRRLADDVGSDPAGGGSPATIAVVRGAPPGPRTARRRALEVWQADTDGPSPWQSLPGLEDVRPTLFGVVGAGGHAFVAGTVDVGSRLTLVSSGVGPDHRHATRARPSGPHPVWVSVAGDTAVAGWSEWAPGQAAAVKVLRSTDRGVTWGASATLEETAGGPHPLASFARDRDVVVAVWARAGDDDPEIAIAVSTDGGALFGPAVAVSAADDGTPSRPRVAVRGQRVLVVWQTEGVNGGVYASSGSLGAGFDVERVRLDTAQAGRRARNPQPWLGGGTSGGVVWESVAKAESGRLPSTSAGPPLVSLHARSLR